MKNLTKKQDKELIFEEIKKSIYTSLQIKLNENPKLKISALAQEKIDDLHRLVRNGIEWCGFTILKTNKIFNNLDSLTNLLVEVEDIILADEGTGVYTEADMSAYAQYLANNPDKMGQPMGYIHSHNHMPAFFSGTDISELCENAPYYAIYVSLIVNYDGKYVCKGAFLADIENEMKINGIENNLFYQIIEDNKKVIIFDFDIINLPKSTTKIDKFGFNRILNEIRLNKKMKNSQFKPTDPIWKLMNENL